MSIQNKIKEMYLAGNTTVAIAKALNVSKSTVSRCTLRAGLREPVAKAGKRLTKGEIKGIQTVYQTTMLSKQVIADRMGISFDTVHHHTKELSREMSKEKQALLVAQYRAGEVTAEELRAREGITKKALYALLRLFKEESANG